MPISTETRRVLLNVGCFLLLIGVLAYEAVWGF